MSDILFVQSVEETEDIDILTYMFGDVIIAPGEVDAIAVTVFGQGKYSRWVSCVCCLFRYRQTPPPS